MLFIKHRSHFAKATRDKHHAFTLIELLVVIVIIGILATLATVALTSARGKARDARRISDLKQISSALELYQADHSSYPNIITPGSALVSLDGSKTYMAKIPNNPTPWVEGACTVGSDYVYNPVGSLTNPSAYNISGCLAKAAGNVSAGEVSMTTNGLVSVDCPARICGDCSTVSCGGTCVTNITSNGTTTAETYPTVQIGSQCWMTKNITNVGTMTTGVVYSDDSLVERACFNNLQANCNTDGALYAWNEAMYLPASAATTQFTAYTGSGATAKRQGICPVGWHIPSDKELATLENYLDPVINDVTNYFADQMGAGGTTGYRGTGGTGVAYDNAGCGHKLKVNGGSNFEGILAGYGQASSFGNRGTVAYFWSSSQLSATHAWRRYLVSTYSQVYRDSYTKTRGFSVRCLKD